MAILAFQQPDKVIMIQADEFKGIFEFRPLEPGFSITIGNALRRILLSSLEGFAITSVRIEGVDHEFSSIKGVMQDVTEMILNLKQIRFRRLVESETFEKVHVVVGESDVFKAGDINKFLTNFQVLNPELEICRMEHNVKMKIDLTIQKGRGYVSAEDNKDINAPLGTIAMDSIHSPIKNVKYTTEDYRVEQKTDYERLVFEIITDGSIHPKDALKEAARVLIHHFMLFSDEKITVKLDKEPITSPDELDENASHIRQLLVTKLTDMDLSVRALNCLKAAELVTLGQLVSYSNKNDLLKFRNFGKKSLTELDNMVKAKGLDFGMKLDKYKLDKFELPEPPNPDEESEKTEKTEKPEKAEKTTKSGKTEKASKPEKVEKVEKAGKPEKATKPEKAEKAEKPEKASKSEKPEKAYKPEKATKPEKSSKSNKS